MRTLRLLLRHLGACGALALGEALGLNAQGLSFLFPAALFAGAMVALLGFGRHLRGWPYLAIFLLGLALALHAENKRWRFFRDEECHRGPFTADLEVRTVASRRGDWVSFTALHEGVNLHVVMPCAAGAREPHVGEIWHCAGWLKHADESDRRARTLWIKGPVAQAVYVRPASCAFGRWLLDALRHRLSRAAGLGLDTMPRAAALNRAIILGERANMPRSVRNVFVGAGTVHIFAISGLHVMVVSGVFLAALLLIGFPLRTVGLVLIPLIWLYVALIGFPPSALRAATMASFFFAAPLVWRRSDSLIAWCETFLLFHILEPGMLFNVGSALSFAVMLGILLFLRWATAMDLSRGAATFGVSFAAWAAGVPIAAHVFGRVTPGGLFANLILIPIASVDVIFGFLGAVFGTFWPFAGAHLNNAAALLTDAMYAISWAVSRLPGANYETEAWSVGAGIYWYVLLLLMAYLAWSVHTRRKIALE